MKNKKLIILTSIIVLVTMCTIVTIALSSKDVTLEDHRRILVTDVKNVQLSIEKYSDTAKDEKTLDLIEFAEGLNFTEINDDTLSELAKITLGLFGKYDKILVRRSFYTDWLERYVTDNSPTDFDTDKVVVYCSKANNGDHSLVYLGLMIELFDKDMYFGDQVWIKHADTLNRGMADSLYFSTNYKNMGYKTIEDYRIAKEKLSDEIAPVKNDELFTRELIGTPLTKDETEKLQKLKEKRDKLFEEQDKLNEGLYDISFQHFCLDKIDGNEELVEGVGYVDHSKWETVSEIAEMK
ncbi:MAG: hypothetical protein J6L23_04005 [Clostridia bacterium]|nr:hypothetical protein [Clostridia bacterium]